MIHISVEDKQNLPNVSTAEDIFHQVDVCSLPFVEVGTSSQRGGHHRKPRASLVLQYLIHRGPMKCVVSFDLWENRGTERKVSYSTLGVKSGLKARSLFP